MTAVSFDKKDFDSFLIGFGIFFGIVGITLLVCYLFGGLVK